MTLIGTQQFVKNMRRWGYWEPIKPEDSLRSLFREGREVAKDKVMDKVDDAKERLEDAKGDVKEKMTEIKGDFKDKFSDWKEKKGEPMKENVKDTAKYFHDDFFQKFEDYQELRRKRERKRMDKEGRRWERH